MVEGSRIVGIERHYFVNTPDRLWISNIGTYDTFPGFFSDRLQEFFFPFAFASTWTESDFSAFDKNNKIWKACLS